MNEQDVLKFWFEELTPEDWFKKDDQLDKEITARFSPIHESAAQGECFGWRQTLEGRLAEIIILDQFSRNIYRNDPRSFAYDGMALVLAQEAIALDGLSQLPPNKKAFLYMPLMHSESLVIHEEALKRFAEPGLEHNLEFEKKHFAILTRFNRYPHRNAIIGRVSTPEELKFLTLPNSSF